MAQIRGVGATSGYVVGLMGPWGYGKSSVLNLVEKELKSVKDFTIIRFNPWLFAGSHELTCQFLAEFSAQLKANAGDAVSNICDKIEEYSDLITSTTTAIATMMGPLAWFASILPGLISQRKAQKSRFNQSATTKKISIENALRKLERRIVVMIDDLDRLSNEEIKDVMRLVRLVGDFSNVTYLLAFDRIRIETALTEEGGREYLDKIIQAPYDLPIIEAETLSGYFTSHLDAILNSKKHGPFFREDWQNYFAFGIAPLIRTPRDAKRVSNAIEMALVFVKEEIAIADLITVETIRVLFPAVFLKISLNPRLFAPTSSGFSMNERGHANQDAQQFLDTVSCAPGYIEAITQLLKRLFPFCQRFTDNTYYDASHIRRWRKDRKIACAEILDFYLERQFPINVPSPSVVNAVFDSLSNEINLNKLLDTFDGVTIENIFDRLEDYEDDFRPEVAEPAMRAIFKSADKLRVERTHIGDFGADLAVARIVLRLLRKIKDPALVFEICKRLMTTVPSLSWRLELVKIVGHRNGQGHKLVSAEDATKLQDRLRGDITTVQVDQLLCERHLPALLYFMNEGGPQDAAVVSKHIADDRIFFAVLKASKAQTISQTIGDAAERIQIRLNWRGLESLLGPDLLKNRVLALEYVKIPDDDGVKMSVKLAIKYAKGELTPDSFHDENDD